MDAYNGLQEMGTVEITMKHTHLVWMPMSIREPALYCLISPAIPLAIAEARRPLTATISNPPRLHYGCSFLGLLVDAFVRKVSGK